MIDITLTRGALPKTPGMYIISHSLNGDRELVQIRAVDMTIWKESYGLEFVSAASCYDFGRKYAGGHLAIDHLAEAWWSAPLEFRYMSK